MWTVLLAVVWLLVLFTPVSCEKIIEFHHSSGEIRTDRYAGAGTTQGGPSDFLFRIHLNRTDTSREHEVFLNIRTSDQSECCDGLYWMSGNVEEPIISASRTPVTKQYSTSERFADLLYRRHGNQNTGIIIRYSVCDVDNSTTDACTIAHAIDDERRSTAYMRNFSEPIIVDSHIHCWWYRFTSPAGQKMPVTPPPTINRCGTTFPIWMNGSHPTRNNQIVNVEGCLESGSNSCEETFPIKVKKCSGYYVYRLMATRVTDSAYCAGDQKRCPRGESSNNGFTPGCSTNFPVLSEPPKVDYRIQATSSREDIVFQCALPRVNGASPGSLLYEAEWYSNDNFLKRENINKTPYRSDLFERSKWKMGSNIWCRVRVRSRNAGSSGVFSPWKNSNKYFAGIKILTQQPLDVHLVNSTQEFRISFQLTVPLLCPFGTLRSCKLEVSFADESRTRKRYVGSCANEVAVDAVKISSYDGINKPRCGVVVWALSWNKTHHHVFTVQKTEGSTTNTVSNVYHIRIKTLGSLYHRIWGNYFVTNFEVRTTATSNGNAKSCNIYGEPRISSFEGTRFSNLNEGEYIIYKHQSKQLPIQVNAYFTRCFIGSCVGGVAARVGRAVAVVSKHQYPKVKVEVNLNGCPELPPGFGLYADSSNSNFMIELPNGARIAVSYVASRLFSILLTPSGNNDPGQTQGLCGVMGAGHNRDLCGRDGRLIGLSNIRAFNSEWRARSGETLIHGHWHAGDCYKGSNFCECQKGQNNEEDKVVCKRQSFTTACVQNMYTNKTSQFLKNTTSFSSDSNDFEKGILHPVDTRTEFMSNEQTPRFVWTEAAARQYCENAFRTDMSNSRCKQLPGVNDQNLISGCASDILAVNGTSFVSHALRTFKDTCLSANTLNVKAYVSVNGTVASPPAVETLLCPSNCSGRGVCLRAACKCSGDFIGLDCSQNINDPPITSQVAAQGGVCSVRNQTCVTVSLYGNNYFPGRKLSCHQDVTMVYPNSRERYSVRRLATYKFESEVVCPLLNPVRTPVIYNISVSNNGVNRSSAVTLSVYDPVCQICAAAGAAPSCSFKADACYINNQCFAAKYQHPNMTCFTCQPDANQTSWTFDKKTCLIDGSCARAGDVNPSRDCFTCQPEKNTSSWTQRDKTCYINDECYNNGAIGNPSLQCVICNATLSTSDWSISRESCLIGGQCYRSGAVDQSDACRSCQPGNTNSNWTRITGCTSYRRPHKNEVWKIIVPIVLILSAIIVVIGVLFVRRSSKKNKVRQKEPQGAYEVPLYPTPRGEEHVYEQIASKAMPPSQNEPGSAAYEEARFPTPHSEVHVYEQIVTKPTPPSHSRF